MYELYVIICYVILPFLDVKDEYKYHIVSYAVLLMKKIETKAPLEIPN